ncbi:MAG: hypothetical protein ABQ298_03935 [Puniceicoccaceae bacterium]
MQTSRFPQSRALTLPDARRKSPLSIIPRFWLLSVLTATIPALGCFSIVFAVASHPLELFLDFQYGLQRWYVLGAGVVALPRIEKPFRNPRCGVTIAPLPSMHSWLRGQLSLTVTIIWIQFLFSLSAWTVACITWNPPRTELLQGLSPTCQLSWFGTAAVCNAILVLLTLSMMRFLHLTGLRLRTATLAGLTLLLIGLAQPDLSRILQIAQWGNAPIFWLSEVHPFIPELCQLDLWWMHHHARIRELTTLRNHAFTSGFAWLLAIHLACLASLQVKRT